MEQIRIVVFDEVDPARAAARQDRQILAALHAFHDFVTFFHNGEVGGEVRVEDFVKTQCAETSHQFTGDRHARFKTEFLTDCHADRRSSLHDHSLGGIVDGVPDFLHIADTGDGTHGADVDALTAEGTGGIRQRDHAGSADLGGEATAVAGEGTHSLHFVTDRFAAAAHDTFAQVAHDRFAGRIHGEFVFRTFVFDFIDAEFRSQFLQFAILVLRAGQAIHRVVGKE